MSSSLYHTELAFFSLLPTITINVLLSDESSESKKQHKFVVTRLDQCGKQDIDNQSMQERIHVQLRVISRCLSSSL